MSKSKVKGGIKWTSRAFAYNSVLSVLKIAILVRFLDKADFGLMALTMFIVGIINLFADMGINTAILHKQEINKYEHSSLYWLNFIFSLILFLLLLLITPLITQMYDAPPLAKILPFMSLGIILTAIGKQFKTIEQKKLELKIISLIEIFAGSISFISATIFAILDFGIYALVFSSLLYYLSSNTLFLLNGIRKQKIIFHLNINETIPFLKIGLYDIGSHIINFLNREIDILLIGKTLGAEILGVYSLSKQLVAKPIEIFSPLIAQIAAPLLSKLKGNIRYLQKSYLKIVNIAITANLPLYFILLIFTKPILHVFYGSSMAEYDTLIRILSLYMLFRVIANPIGSLLVGTGRTDLGFKWNIFLLILFPIFIYTGSLQGIHGVAWAMVLIMVISFVPFWRFMVKPLIGVPFNNYLSNLVPRKESINYILESFLSIFKISNKQ